MSAEWKQNVHEKFYLNMKKWSKDKKKKVNVIVRETLKKVVFFKLMKKIRQTRKII